MPLAMKDTSTSESQAVKLHAADRAPSMLVFQLWAAPMVFTYSESAAVYSAAVFLLSIY